LWNQHSGSFVPIDYGDATGMNCFDLKEKKWIDSILNWAQGTTSLNLKELLGDPCPSDTKVGLISNYFSVR
jgi:sugar (pentulose or hexulose) kinase